MTEPPIFYDSESYGRWLHLEMLKLKGIAPDTHIYATPNTDMTYISSTAPTTTIHIPITPDIKATTTDIKRKDNVICRDFNYTND